MADLWGQQQQPHAAAYNGSYHNGMATTLAAAQAFTERDPSRPADIGSLDDAFRTSWTTRVNDSLSNKFYPCR